MGDLHCPDGYLCVAELVITMSACLADLDAVVDEDTFLACMADYFDHDCHDCLCAACEIEFEAACP